MNPFEMNAHIESLIATRGQDGDAARAIIAAYHKLPRRGAVSYVYAKQSDSEDSFTGATGRGQVTVKDERKETVEHSFGIKKERVGYYKLWKEKDDVLIIQYFWKSDITTQSLDDEPPRYRLGYHDDLSPKYFGKEVEVPFVEWTFWRTRYRLMRTMLEVYTGEVAKTSIGYSLMSITNK